MVGQLNSARSSTKQVAIVGVLESAYADRIQDAGTTRGKTNRSGQRTPKASVNMAIGNLMSLPDDLMVLANRWVAEERPEAAQRIRGAAQHAAADLLGNDRGRADAGTANSDAPSGAWVASYDVMMGYLVGLNPGSTRSYAAPLRDLFAYSRNLGISPVELDRRALEAYLAHLRDGRQLAPATVARHASVIAAFLAFAVEQDVAPENAMRLVRRPKVADNSPTFTLDAGHVHAMIRAAQEHSLRAYCLTVALFTTGARISAMLGADVTDLGLEAGHRTLRIRRKGATGWHTLILPGEVAAVFDDYIGDRDGMVFITRSGAAWDRSGASRLLHRLADQALPVVVARRFRPHDTRVAAIGLALSAGAGADPMALMRSTGHVRFSSLQRYAVWHRQLREQPVAALVASLVLPPATPVCAACPP